VEHELLERMPSLWDDQESMYRSTGGEDFLDGPSAGDE
jgi:hypothetical protein